MGHDPWGRDMADPHLQLVVEPLLTMAATGGLWSGYRADVHGGGIDVPPPRADGETATDPGNPKVPPDPVQPDHSATGDLNLPPQVTPIPHAIPSAQPLTEAVFCRP